MPRSFRTLSLITIFVLALCVTGFASAQPAKVAALQATATPIDPGQVVKLDFGTAVTTPLNKDDVSYRYFSFKGKANQLVTVTVQKLTGNLGLKIDVRSQSDADLIYGGGDFFEASTLTVKLPQDGNYRVNLIESDPGAGDFEAGTVSVMVAEAKPVAAATATK